MLVVSSLKQYLTYIRHLDIQSCTVTPENLRTGMLLEVIISERSKFSPLLATLTIRCNGFIADIPLLMPCVAVGCVGILRLWKWFDSD